MFIRKRAAVIAALAVLAASSSAHALSCTNPLLQLVQPVRGAHVPRNVRVWVGAEVQPAQYRWSDAGGQPVAFTVTRIAVGSAFLDMLTADALLPAETPYRVQACDPSGRDGCRELTSFATNGSVDNEAPMLPEASEGQRLSEQDDAWGDTRLVTFEVRGDVIQLLDVDGAGGASPLQAGSELGDVAASGKLLAGEAPCFTNITSERAEVRFGTLDLAGNFSGFTEPREVVKPEQLSDGCSVAGTQSPGWALMVVLGLAARRRRTGHVRS
jgi:MYXO-CTERM domain-containing protein